MILSEVKVPAFLSFLGEFENVLKQVSYTCITMNTRTKVKCWGNSLGIVLPKSLVEQEELKEGEEVEVTVRKVSDIRQVRGEYPFKNLQREKDKMRRGWE